MSAPIPDREMSVTLLDLFLSPDGLEGAVKCIRASTPHTYYPDGVVLEKLYHATLRALERRRWVENIASGYDQEGRIFITLRLTHAGQTILEEHHAESIR